jgi:hypothetical protein
MLAPFCSTGRRRKRQGEHPEYTESDTSIGKMEKGMKYNNWSAKWEISKMNSYDNKDVRVDCVHYTAPI